jgi:hypothetical protein
VSNELTRSVIPYITVGSAGPRRIPWIRAVSRGPEPAPRLAPTLLSPRGRMRRIAILLVTSVIIIGCAHWS